MRVPFPFTISTTSLRPLGHHLRAPINSVDSSHFTWSGFTLLSFSVILSAYSFHAYRDMIYVVFTTSHHASGLDATLPFSCLPDLTFSLVSSFLLFLFISFSSCTYPRLLFKLVVIILVVRVSSFCYLLIWIQLLIRELYVSLNCFVQILIYEQ